MGICDEIGRVSKRKVSYNSFALYTLLKRNPEIPISEVTCPRGVWLQRQDTSNNNHVDRHVLNPIDFRYKLIEKIIVPGCHRPPPIDSIMRTINGTGYKVVIKFGWPCPIRARKLQFLDAYGCIEINRRHECIHQYDRQFYIIERKLLTLRCYSQK